MFNSIRFFISHFKELNISNLVNTQLKCVHNLSKKHQHDDRDHSNNRFKKKYPNKNAKNTNDSFLRILNRNDKSGGTSYKKFRLAPMPSQIFKNDGKKFIFNGKSDNLAETIDNKDPESLLDHDEDLDLYASNEKLYHQKQIDEDIHKQRKIKISIINKKMKKLEGENQLNFNLVTWDAKEQIKYLHLNEPGKNKFFLAFLT